MKRTLWIMMILFFVTDVVGLTINEIMYNSPGNDNNQEFIELLLDEPINLSGFIVGDAASNDTLVAINITNSTFALIVEEGFNITGINASFYSAGATIGNNLDNDGDTIFLYDLNGTLLTNASYNGSIADGNGYSIEFVNKTAYESKKVGGTPGRNNSILDMNESLNETSNMTNLTEDIVEITDECSPKFAISTSKFIYENKAQVAFSFKLNHSEDFIIEYGIEDMFGEIVKAFRNTTNLKTKTFTPKIKEKDKVLVVKAKLYVSCTEVIAEARKEFIVLNQNAEENYNEKNDEDIEENQKSMPRNDESTKLKINYDLLNMPKTISQELKTQLLIENDNQKRHFEIWSYVYRGPKSYSGEKEGNLQEIDLLAGEAIVLDLENTIDASPGDYKYKIKIRKDDQKSTTDLIREIKIIANTTNITEQKNISIVHPDLATRLEKVQKQSDVEPSLPVKHQTTVYEGKSARIERGIPFFLLALFALVVLVFVWKS